MARNIFKLVDNFPAKLFGKLLRFLYRVLKKLLLKSVQSSSLCFDPYLTHFCGIAASLAFAGAILSVHPHTRDGAKIFICLNVLSISYLCLVATSKFLIYTKQLEIVKKCLFCATTDMKKILANRKLDYFCQLVWMLMVRAGLVTPMCMGHYVWQPAKLSPKPNTSFMILFFIFQLFLARYRLLQCHLLDSCKLFEIHVFHAQTKLKKRWQLSIFRRIHSTLVATGEMMLDLHEGNCEISAIYSFLAFSTLSTYILLSSGDEGLQSNPLFTSCTFFQLLFLFSTEFDLRMINDTNRAIYEKISSVELMFEKPPRDCLRVELRQETKNIDLTIFLSPKYMKRCLVYAVSGAKNIHDVIKCLG